MSGLLRDKHCLKRNKYIKLTESLDYGGYGDQYQTTSYGAQGGAGGGGFMNQYGGSQSGSQGTPSKVLYIHSARSHT